MHISQVVSVELSKERGVDLLLQALVKACPDPTQGDPQDPVLCASLDCAVLAKLSKSEWIITLLQVLI